MNTDKKTNIEDKERYREKGKINRLSFYGSNFSVLLPCSVSRITSNWKNHGWISYMNFYANQAFNSRAGVSRLFSVFSLFLIFLKCLLENLAFNGKEVCESLLCLMKLFAKFYSSSLRDSLINDQIRWKLFPFKCNLLGISSRWFHSLILFYFIDVTKISLNSTESIIVN